MSQGEHDMSRVQRVALITGAARRIGAAIAKRLHEAGFDLVVHGYHSADELRALADALQTHRRDSVLTVQADLRNGECLPELVAKTIDRFGRLDALVNNASGFYPTPLAEVTAPQWDELFAVNARAPFFLIREAAPYLRASRGAIVNLTDIYAARPLRDHAVYSAAKAALVMLTRSLALDLAPHVRVNGIAPGAILWPQQGTTEVAKQALLARTPLGRIGTVEEIAETARWLLQDAGFMTGQILEVDGGRQLT